MPDLPSVDVKIRVSCGTFSGLRAHASQLEPMCAICAAFVDAEKLEAERRRPTPPAPTHLGGSGGGVTDHNVIPIRGGRGSHGHFRRVS